MFDPAIPLSSNEDPVALTTVQFVKGSVLNGEFEPLTDLLHLILVFQTGGAGAGEGRITLCGADLYAADGTGYCMSSGVPVDQFVPCPDCVDRARREYPKLPVKGVDAFAQPMAEALGVEAILL
jgi:hypothetical protein